MIGLILDIAHKGNEIKLFVKTNEGIKVLTDEFNDYFYLISSGDTPRLSDPRIKSTEMVKRVVDGIEKDVLKITVKEAGDLFDVRESLKEFGETREYDISLTDKYMFEKGIVPMGVYEIEKTEDGLEFKKTGENPGLNTISFDIETYNPSGTSNPEKDPVIMISYCSANERGIFTWKKIDLDFVKTLETERDCIGALEKKVQNYDIIYTYNGDNFDLPYLRQRAGKLGLGLGGENIKLRKSREGYFADIPGRPHVDVFQGISFLEGIGAIKILRYTLEDVYKAVLGKDKIDVEGREIWKSWDSEGKELETLAKYSLQDAVATYELGEYILPLFIELSRLTGKTIYHAVRVSASNIVESLLIKEAHTRGELVPRRPKEEEIRHRIGHGFVGGYVKEPTPGLHENIAVLDFRSLYPSIIISHNIDPFTLDKEGKCKDYYESPNGYRFCKDRKGLIPTILRKVIEKRIEIKKKMKEYPKDSLEYKELYARQWSLKIAANATFGYMGYARARWYSMECAKAITAWGRYYVGKLISEAEKAGFEVIYADTDSAFIKLGNKSKEDVFEFLRGFNSSLPEFMEVEFEGFYKRGIFVTRKIGKGAAKKRYALLSENGEMKITGLEFVRTDWSELAKEIQKTVLRQVLEGDVEQAKNTVREAIDKIRKGEYPLEKYTVYTQLKRNISQYDAIGPHVRAAQRLAEAGHIITPGMLIGYIVTKGGGNIGNRAYPYFPVNLVGNREPDPDYYINNQVLPAVMKILREIGVTEEDLKQGGKQSSISQWF